jgi:hypothetical protein
MLRPMASWPSSLVVKPKTRFLLLSDSCGLADVERTGLPFTIAAGLASAVIPGSESRRTHDHILLSQRVKVKVEVTHCD